MRLLLPLGPAWLGGLWLLLFSDRIWSPLPAATARPGEGLVGGWVVLGALVVGSLCHLAAPVLGRNLAVWTPGSATAGLGAADPEQEAFGTWVVRVATLVGLYLLLAGFVGLELRAAA